MPSGSYRRRTAWIAGAVAASSLGLLLMQAPVVMNGETVHLFARWVPEIGMNLGLKLDGLSLMFAADHGHGFADHCLCG